MTLLSWRRCDSTTHREQSAAAHDLLCATLQKAGVEKTPLAVTAEGRPYFPAHPEVDFNLSHTKGMVVCALAIGTLQAPPRVGVDIENTLTDTEKAVRLARRFFRESELRYFEEAEEKGLAFVEIFTAKEAYGKFTGEGLAVHLGDDTMRKDFGKRTKTAFFRYRIGTYCITLCQKAEMEPPAPPATELND